MAGRLRDQRGSGTALLGAVVAVLLLVVWVGSIGGGYAVALHRARAMADRAALAGALAMAQGQDPCRAARAQTAAEEQPGRLAECRQVGDLYRYVVSVRAEYRVSPAFPGLPDSVGASAHAGPVDVGPLQPETGR